MTAGVLLVRGFRAQEPGGDGPFGRLQLELQQLGDQGSHAGQMEVGALTAFLSYLMQILMSVMMATFVLISVPRASVSADRIGEVLVTESSVVPPPLHPTAGTTRRAARPGPPDPVLPESESP